jgi:hypothetical protein
MVVKASREYRKDRDGSSDHFDYQFTGHVFHHKYCNLAYAVNGISHSAVGAERKAQGTRIRGRRPGVRGQGARQGMELNSPNSYWTVR